MADYSKLIPTLAEMVSAAKSLGAQDAAADLEPLWFQVGESYVCAETGHTGNTEVASAYVAAYNAIKAAPPLSDELRDGIRAYKTRIAALGGYGTLVSAQMPDGVVRRGVLREFGFGGCQPGIVTSDGRRFRVNLDRVSRD